MGRRAPRLRSGDKLYMTSLHMSVLLRTGVDWPTYRGHCRFVHWNSVQEMGLVFGNTGPIQVTISNFGFQKPMKLNTYLNLVPRLEMRAAVAPFAILVYGLVIN
jgi:hypothetical protein